MGIFTRIKVIKLAKTIDLKIVKYIGHWKEYKVYDAYMSKKECSYTGLPHMILADNRGNIRWATGEEVMNIMDTLY